jgi:hypothetical protein
MASQRFGNDKAMSDANRRAFNRGYIAVANVAVSLVEVYLIVISRFPFRITLR